MRKKAMALLLSAVLTMTGVVPAFAADDITEPVTIAASEGEEKDVKVGNVTITSEVEQEEDAVKADADGGNITLKTGDINGSGEGSVEGAFISVSKGGKAVADLGAVRTNGEGACAESYDAGSKIDLTVGNINSQDTGLVAFTENGAETDIETGSIISEDYAAYIETSGEGSKFNALIDGSISSGERGMQVGASNGGEANVFVTSDVYGDGDGACLFAESGGKASAMIAGNAVSGDKRDVLFSGNAVSSVAYGDGSEADILVGGDAIAKNNYGAAVNIENADGGKNSITIGGTVKGGGTPIVMFQGSDINNVNITVWKVEPNANGVIAGIENEDGSVSQSTELEKSINYIIQLEDTSGARLSAQDTAHEGEKVVLKIDVDSDYELRGAFNGKGEKVALLKDENGEYYVIVPRGGGVYLSVDLHRKEKDNDKKDDNIIIPNSGISEGASYATADAFNSSAASMIASAAPGASVTINGTSFTGISAAVVAALMARSDVTFVLTYTLNGVTFVVTIPAGTNLAGFLNAQGGIDFASLAAFTALG